MKAFENAPARYDGAMQLLTLGRIGKLKRAIADAVSGSGRRVLELGCGPGNLWRGEPALPSGLALTLTDLSTGMLSEARNRIGELETFSYASCDAQSLPFPDERFDVIVANHMLYHVPDKARALAEMRRTLEHRAGRT